MVVLFLQTDLGGGGGTGCQGRSPAGTERRWWILISCGPATAVGQGSTSTGPAATPRRRAPGVATRSARRHSSSCAGKRQMCRKTCCSDARAWQERAQTTRLHQRDHKAAAGRRCRCRFGPGFRCHPEPLTDGDRKVS